MCLVAGGSWSSTSNAGVWAVNFWNTRNNTNANNGFRADSTSPHAQQCDGGAKGDAFRRDASASAKWAGFRHSGRAGNSLESLAT
jgi:hypothetical protein